MAKKAKQASRPSQWFLAGGIALGFGLLLAIVNLALGVAVANALAGGTLFYLAAAFCFYWGSRQRRRMAQAEPQGA